MEMLERLNLQLVEWDEVESDLKPMAAKHPVGFLIERQSDAMGSLRHLQADALTLLRRNLAADTHDHDVAIKLITTLTPKTPVQIAEVEEAVVEASADPEKRGLAQNLAEKPAQPELQNLSRWAIFVLASADFIKATESANPNVLTALSIIVMIWIFLRQRPS